MIQIKNLELHFGDQVVFDNVNCLINQNNKVGIVGRNGTGKSTLLKIIARQMRADKGTVDIQKGFKIAYMPQEVVILSTKSVLDEVLSVFSHLFEITKEKEKLEIIMEEGLQTEHDVNRYAEIELELIEANFNDKRSFCQKILSGLGFDEKKQNQTVNELSVGWRMRVVLAKLLSQEADFYLFDEPTNHLDISTKDWFLNFLKNNSYGYLLVCHDRYFLDKACSLTYELSMGNLNIFQGNYSYYLEQKAFLTEQRKTAHEKQKREIAQREKTIDRFKATASKAKMAQSMIKALDKIERIELEDTQRTMSLKLHSPQKSGKLVLKVDHVSHSFDHQLFKNVSFEVERGDKVAIIAPNGTGKTTLFNLIAKKLALQAGTIEIGYNVQTSLFDQDQDKVLDPKATVYEEVSSTCNVTEQQLRSILGALLFDKDGIKKKCGVLSGGERNRVAMGKVILSNANLLLLDEPTNHLDIESKEIILQALQKFDGTIIFVSHDQDFVNRLSNKIIELNSHGAFLYLGNYDSYLAVKEYTQKEMSTISNVSAQDVILKINKVPEDIAKKVKTIERKVERLETSLQAVIKSLEVADYGTKRFQDLEEEYKKLQVLIAQETIEWEAMLKEIQEEKK